MAEVKDLKTSIDGLIALHDRAFGNTDDAKTIHLPKGRKKGSIQYANDEQAVDWIIQEIKKSDLAYSIHIRAGIKKFSLKGTGRDGIYDRIRKKVRQKLKDGN